MRKLSIKKTTRSDLITYGMIIVVCAAVALGMYFGWFKSQQQHIGGMLVPICCWVVMALSLNLTVGILGELSLGHAGFMSVGAFSGITAWASFADVIPNTTVRLIVSMIFGAIMAAIFGFLIGIPVLRLKGDYLAIVTLAFGEIIKDLITLLHVGIDSHGLHFAFGAKASLVLEKDGIEIISGAQGVSGISLPESAYRKMFKDTGMKAVQSKTCAQLIMFAIGFVLIMITLAVILNFIRSRTGRAVMAIRDNRIAAESVGIGVMKYKMTAFVVSAALAGAAGALFAMSQTSMKAADFNFDKSILILVFVVLGGLGNMRGTFIATVLLYLLPELLRGFSTYRMLIYAIILIAVMLISNNEKLKQFFGKIFSRIAVMLISNNEKLKQFFGKIFSRKKKDDGEEADVNG